ANARRDPRQHRGFLCPCERARLCGALLPANSMKAQAHTPAPSPRDRLRRPRQWQHRRRNSSPQPLRVEGEVIADKALDEVVGVVIPLLPPQRELLFGEPARFLEKL